MEIKIGSKEMLKVLYIICWLLFIGVGIEAGGFIFNAIFTFALEPEAGFFWKEIDLSSLYKYDPGYFVIMISVMIIVSVMRAIMFYLIIRILHNKKLSVSQPFNKEMQRFISGLSSLALGVGLFSHCGVNYSEWLVKQGVEMPDVLYLRLGGEDVWIFMGIILLIIAQIFKRGIEIQSENDLTI